MIKLKENKSFTAHKVTEKAPLPSSVYIPLSQHLGKICTPQVNIGDTVLVGQRIADSSAQVYAPIHSSLSGKVTSIQDYPHPVLGKCMAIVIENDGQDKSQKGKLVKSKEEINKLSAEDIRKIIFNSGIVGLGGASFPTHIKLNPPKPVDTLIINGAECEPYLTSDFRLMLEKTKEILLGIELVARCLGVKSVYIAIEDNKPEAIKAFKDAIHTASVHLPSNKARCCDTPYAIRILKSHYPQGGEKQLIKSVLNLQVPSGKLPFDLGVIVQNVATIFAIYEAVYLDKPLYERIVTVTGSCLSNPKNLLVRIGTPIKELIDFCGPLKEEPAKIIIGGPMMGIAQYTDTVPVIKSTTGIVLLNKRESKTQEEEFCIRCGACVRACPMGLAPCLINLASEKELWTETKAYRALDCIECGLCNFTCPANRRLTQSIKRAKLEVNK